MRKFSFTVSVLFLFFDICSGQYNPYTNTINYAHQDSISSKSESNTSATQAMSGIVCNQGYFYGITSSTGNIDRLILNNNTVQFDAASILTSSNMSIAFSNDLTGGPFSPTFYCDDPATTTNAPVSYNGSTWITNTPGYPISLANCGGFGNYVYFSGVTSMITSVVRYTGTAFNVVYQCTGNTKICVGDLAVDSIGNVYFLISTNFSSMISDSLMIVSSTGQIVQQIPFQINFNHSYGAFMMNGVYYIGFGSSNTVHPNSLLPITISTSAAIAGTPISNPWSTYVDLASCDPGIPESVFNYSLQSDFSISPNPTSEIISINFNSTGYTLLKIFSAEGNLVLVKSIGVNDQNMEINLSFLNPGIYFIELQGNKSVTRKKIVKY